MSPIAKRVSVVLVAIASWASLNSLGAQTRESTTPTRAELAEITRGDLSCSIQLYHSGNFEVAKGVQVPDGGAVAYNSSASPVFARVTLKNTSTQSRVFKTTVQARATDLVRTKNTWYLTEYVKGIGPFGQPVGHYQTSTSYMISANVDAGSSTQDGPIHVLGFDKEHSLPNGNGKITVVAKVDSYNDIAENDEGNNSCTADVVYKWAGMPWGTHWWPSK
jgi:hypothetical protein